MVLKNPQLIISIKLKTYSLDYVHFMFWNVLSTIMFILWIIHFRRRPRPTPNKLTNQWPVSSKLYYSQDILFVYAHNDMIIYPKTKHSLSPRSISVYFVCIWNTTTVSGRSALYVISCIKMVNCGLFSTIPLGFWHFEI